MNGFYLPEMAFIRPPFMPLEAVIDVDVKDRSI
jgi:hypothetical protein